MHRFLRLAPVLAAAVVCAATGTATASSVPPSGPAVVVASGPTGVPVDIGARGVAFDPPHDETAEEVIAELGFGGIRYPTGDAELLAAFVRHEPGSQFRGLAFAVSVDGEVEDIITPFQASFPDSDNWYSDVIIEGDETTLRVSDFAELNTGVAATEPRPPAVQVRVSPRETPGEFNLTIEERWLGATEVPAVLATPLAPAYDLIGAIGAEAQYAFYYWGYSEADQVMEREARVVYAKAGTDHVQLGELVRTTIGPVTAERQDPDGTGGFAFDVGALSYYFNPDGTGDAVVFLPEL